MRISAVTASTHTNELGGKVWNPALRWVRKHAVFVEMYTEDGYCGLGECWCFDSAPDALLAFLRTEVVPHVLGRTVAEVPGIAAERLRFATLSARHGVLASALSGLDIAIADLAAQGCGKPLWKWLDPGGPGKTRLYASGGLYGEAKTADDLADEVRGFVRDGFRLVKMKVGGEDRRTDLTRVTAALCVLPPDARLIVDGVYSFSADAALAFFESLPADRIEAFQSPVPAADIAGMVRLVRAGVPVMAVEAEYRAEIHDALVEQGAVRFLQVAPVACGGISRVRELAARLDGTPVELSLEVSSTAVALAAAMHVAAATPRVAHVEHHSVHTVFFDEAALASRAPSKDRVAPPALPGLGVRLPSSGVTRAFTLGGDSRDAHRPCGGRTDPEPSQRRRGARP